MADLTVSRSTTLPSEDVLVRAVQFFTNEKWRAQSQTNRVATFIGMAPIPWFQIAVALILLLCLIIPGIIYYYAVILKLRRMQNTVVTTTPAGSGSEVVVSYPPHAQKMVDAFFAALA
jgi:hypothetical protein